MEQNVHVLVAAHLLFIKAHMVTYPFSICYVIVHKSFHRIYVLRPGFLKIQINFVNHCKILQTLQAF